MKVSRALLFQASLLATLIATIVSATSSVLLAAIVFAALFSASALVSRGLKHEEKRVALFLLGFIALLCIAFTAIISSKNTQTLFYLPFVLLAFLAVFIVFKTLLFKKEVNATVVGYSNGYAVVRVDSSLAHDVKTGLHAVKSKPVAVGSRVRVRVARTFFGTRLQEVVGAD